VKVVKMQLSRSILGAIARCISGKGAMARENDTILGALWSTRWQAKS
jgi:hypothetical protein